MANIINIEGQNYDVSTYQGAINAQKKLVSLGYKMPATKKNKDGIDGFWQKNSINAYNLYVTDLKKQTNTKLSNEFLDWFTSLFKSNNGSKRTSDLTNIQGLSFSDEDIANTYDRIILLRPELKGDLTNLTNIYLQCSSYINNMIRSKLGKDKANKLGFRGNAWQIGDSIVKSGGQELFNLYSTPEMQSILYEYFPGAKTIGNDTKKVAAKYGNFSDLFLNLRVGDVIGLYYDNSPATETAYKDNGNHARNTHIGIITSIDEKGRPVVSHNIHGTVYHEPLVKGTTRNGFVVSAYRPSYKHGGNLNKQYLFYFR